MVCKSCHRPPYLAQLPVPGTLPQPPQIPRDLRSPTPESAPSSPIPTQRQTFYDVLAGEKHDYVFASAQRSPSTWSSDRGTSPRSPSLTGLLSNESTATRGTKASSSISAVARKNGAGSGKGNRGYESPASDEEPGELHETISKAIDTIIQKDPGWVDFFRAKAAPQRASEVLKQYRFVQRIMDAWVGKRAPFRTCHHVVEAVSTADLIYAWTLLIPT